jgi:hypothetical protein
MSKTVETIKLEFVIDDLAFIIEALHAAASQYEYFSRQAESYGQSEGKAYNDKQARLCKEIARALAIAGKLEKAGK